MRHLDEALSPYADRSLSAAALLACDQHVSICPGCRAAADAERRLLRSLRSAATPGLSSGLQSALLGLAGQSVLPASTMVSAPLAVMGRSAPALYHSPLRAAMMAGLVAGASVAAAWSLSVNGVGVPGKSSPVLRLPASAATAGSTTGDGSSSLAATFLATNQGAGSVGLTATSIDISTHTVPVVVAPPWTGVPDLSRR
ncbi:MAG: zf-HC2 domain-containing protein [Phycicoccus sp.]|nr:zf-HC2 domain-containing protein [Phycicoccus sp.]NMM34873.1 zf-HC2 domain-containing protein [Phycicoccus sp.]